jgi:murein L,D-transpeptidase YafK
MKQRGFGIAVGLTFGLFLAGCAGAPELPPAARPLSKDTLMQLGKKGLEPGSQMFVRIFKEESELELWKQRPDGRFYHFKSYPICTWSGELGPKLKEGDKQAPEGFYSVAKPQMNPNSSFHLAFNLGFPNAFDRAHGRTGSALMVHGKCKSAGCYAMTDALIEEIYALARESFDAGHSSFQVHAYPFRMTDANMERHKSSKWHGFWKVLKEGHDLFEQTRVPPPVVVCGRQYRVNVTPLRNVSMRIDPAGQCPELQKVPVEPFVPKVDQQMAEERTLAPGPKMRSIAAVELPPSATASTGIAGLLGGMSSVPAISFGLGASPSR